jgi:hypothetical protein
MNTTRSRTILTSVNLKAWFSVRLRIPVIAVTLIISALSAGCGSTKMVHSWKSPDFKGPAFHKVLVIGLASQPDVRRVYEDAFVKHLQAAGIDGVASNTLLLTPQTAGKAAIGQAAARSGADAVLVTHLVKTVKEAVGDEPQPGIQEYVDTSWPGTYTPAGSTQIDVVTLETRLFDAASTRVVWSGTTETFAAQKLQQAIEDVSRIIVQQLKSQKML